MGEALEQKAVEFVAACHAIARRGLVRCSSGNLSWRVDADRFLATASRSWLGELTRAQVCVCRLADGTVLDGPKPTVELGFHAGILRARPDVNVVLHFQTSCATALACRAAGAPVNYFVIPEIPYYIGPVAEVPYLPPGSPELAAAVVAAMREHDLALMRNHGQITVARDLAHAVQNAEFFELACEIVLRAGPALEPLPGRAADDLLRLRSEAIGRAV
jgi:ribulose-5-phosphate 4-epimerase/fuculose-1-phosphate aldolase